MMLVLGASLAVAGQYLSVWFGQATARGGAGVTPGWCLKYSCDSSNNHEMLGLLYPNYQFVHYIVG